MRPPVWLLDVDGVLNALVGRGRPDRSAWPDWARADVADSSDLRFPICWSPQATSRIADLHTRGVVEARWLTSWEDDANGELREVLGLPELPVAGYAAGRSLDTWWKWQVAMEVHEQDPTRPMIWTDDDLTLEPAALAWARRRAHTLPLAPPHRLGLTPRLLRSVDTFLASLPAGEPSRV